MVTTSPFWAGRAGSGRLEARVLLAQEPRAARRPASRSPTVGRAHELEPLVVDLVDLRLHLEARLVRERARRLELARLDLRLVDRLDVLLGERLRERLVHDRVDDVVRDLRPVEVREHLARRLARAEASRAPSLERRVRLLDLGLHVVRRDLDGELHHDGRDALDRDLHLGDREHTYGDPRVKAARPAGGRMSGRRPLFSRPVDSSLGGRVTQECAARAAPEPLPTSRRTSRWWNASDASSRGAHERNRSPPNPSLAAPSRVVAHAPFARTRQARATIPTSVPRARGPCIPLVPGAVPDALPPAPCSAPRIRRSPSSARSTSTSIRGYPSPGRERPFARERSAHAAHISSAAMASGTSERTSTTRSRSPSAP